jgi:hypothetical protein
MSLLRLLVCLEHDARTFLSRALPQVGLLLLEHHFGREQARTRTQNPPVRPAALPAAFAVKEKFAVALIPIIPARQQP